MNAKLKFMFVALACACICARAETAMEQLVADTLRYGSTQEKRDKKEQSRKELFSMRADALRYVMTKVQYDNINVQVLAQNLVDELKKDEAVPVLLDFINDSNTNTQKSAIYFLGYYNAPEHAEKITPFLQNEKLRGVAIRTLGKWKVSDATPRIAAYFKDENERVRVAAANALRDIGDPRAIGPLIAAQKDPVFTVRNTALRALVSFGPAAEQPMLDALDKANGQVRRQLVRGLGELRSARAVKPLRNFSEGDDSALRDDARRALLMIDLSKL